VRIVLSYQSDLQIYEQIKEHIKTDILSGQISEGDALPSIRQLARELKVSVITTTRAYSDLELEGFISTVPGKGCYVKQVDSAIIRAQYLQRTEAALMVALQHASTAGLTTREIHDLLDKLKEQADA